MPGCRRFRRTADSLRAEHRSFRADRPRFRAVRSCGRRFGGKAAFLVCRGPLAVPPPAPIWRPWSPDRPPIIVRVSGRSVQVAQAG